MDWTPLYSDLAEWAIAVLWALTVVFLLPYIKAKVASIKDSNVRRVVDALVAAAEQKFGPGTGTEKFRWVIDQAAKRGVRVDEADIEASVYALTGKAA